MPVLDRGPVLVATQTGTRFACQSRVFRRLLPGFVALTMSLLVAVSGQAATFTAHVMCPPAHPRSCGSIPSAEHACCIRHGSVRRDLTVPESEDTAVPMQLPRSVFGDPPSARACRMIIEPVAVAHGSDLFLRFVDLRL